MHPTPHVDPPWIGIAPLRRELISSYNECLDAVAREGQYLMMSRGPSLEDSTDFVDYVLEARFPLWMAFIPGPKVIGWCDICPQRWESRAHVGVLGLGIHADFRGQGIGELLMDRALRQARTRGIERVELDVYSSNERAMHLYFKMGFVQEGIKHRARKFNGKYEDIIIMAKSFKPFASDSHHDQTGKP